MATLMPEGKQSFTSSAGVPLVGGKLYTYDAGTSTPRPTYQDAAGVTPNTNPVILDARGEATVFWNGAYKAILKDASDVTIWTVDNIATISTATLAADDGAGGTKWTTIQGFINRIISSAGSLYMGFVQLGSAFIRTVQDKLRDSVNGADFGMSTAASSAVNKAALISALGASSYVRIPSGTFNIDGPIDVTNKTIKGEGIYRTILQVPGVNTATTLFYNNKTSGASWGTGGNLDLRSLSLRGNWDGATALTDQSWDATAALVKFGSGAGIRLVDVAIQNQYGHGISFYQLGYATFTRVKVNTSAKNGIHLEAPSGALAITSTYIQNCDLNSNRGAANLYIKNGIGVGVSGTVFEDALAGVQLDGNDNRNVTISGNHCETNTNGLLHYIGSGIKVVLTNNFGDADWVRTNPAFQTLHAVNNVGMTNVVEEGFGPFGQDLEFGQGTVLNNNRKLSYYGTANTNDVIGRLSWRSNNNFNAGFPVAEVRSVATGNVNQAYGALELGTGFNGLVYRVRLNENGHMYPLTDNAYTLGASGARWASVWAANGAIQTSDIRTKTEVENTVLGLSFINSLRPVSYKYKLGRNDVEPVQVGEDKDGVPQFEAKVIPVPGVRRHYGLIAQEVKAALPPEVDFGGWVLQDASNPDSEQALRYDQFISPLIRAVQELSRQAEELKQIKG